MVWLVTERQWCQSTLISTTSGKFVLAPYVRGAFTEVACVGATLRPWAHQNSAGSVISLHGEDGNAKDQSPVLNFEEIPV
jgi:hypothetical protein